MGLYEIFLIAIGLGMDSFAYGLLKAAEMIEDGRIDAFIDEKYKTWEGELGVKIREGKATLSELAERAAELRNKLYALKGFEKS